MRDARESHKDDSLADMLCLLVYEFGIDEERVLEMPYTRCVVMLKWLEKIMKQKAGQGGSSFSEKGMFR